MTRALLAAGAAAIALPLLAAPAAQATDYRYWTYWHGTAGAWQFAQTGAAASVPADGDVEGWRFAVTTGIRGQGAEPRIAVATAFRQFCGSVAPEAGRKRVAIVFDYGTNADAPPGETPPPPRGRCAVVATGATGAQILSQHARVRTNAGLVCAIDGFPARECAPAISTPTPRPTRTPAATATPTPTSSPTGTATPSRSPKARETDPATPSPTETAAVEPDSPSPTAVTFADDAGPADTGSGSAGWWGLAAATAGVAALATALLRRRRHPAGDH